MEVEAVKLKMFAGSTSKLIRLFIQDSSQTDGRGLAGLAYNTSGLTCYYIREGAGASVSVSLASMTIGTWLSGGFIEVDSTNMPGVYELGLPDAVVAAAAKSVVMMLRGAGNMVPMPLEIELDAVQYQDAVRFGLTAVPNASAGASGGLPTLDSSLGVTLRSLDSMLIANGTASAGSTTTLTLAGASATDNIYNGQLLVIKSGTGASQVRVISSYVGSTKVATVGIPFVTTPDNTSVFAVYAARLAILGTDGRVLVSADVHTAGETVAGITGVSFPGNFNLLSIDASGRVDLAKWIGVAPDALSSGKVPSDLKLWLATAPAAVTTNGFVKTALLRWLTDDAAGTPNALATNRVDSSVGAYPGNTAQTGDSYARLGAPAGGVSISDDVHNVKLDTASIITTLSTLAAAVAAAVWGASVRTLTDFGSLAADAATAVWVYLTSNSLVSGSFGELVANSLPEIETQADKIGTSAGDSANAVTAQNTIQANLDTTVSSATAAATTAANNAQSAFIQASVAATEATNAYGAILTLPAATAAGVWGYGTQNPPVSGSFGELVASAVPDIQTQADKIGTALGDSPNAVTAQDDIIANVDTTISSVLAAATAAATAATAAAAAAAAAQTAADAAAKPTDIFLTPANKLNTDTDGNVIIGEVTSAAMTDIVEAVDAQLTSTKGAGPWGASAGGTGPWKITGIITDAGTGLPVPNAKVGARNGVTIRAVGTDVNGAYRFDVANGIWSLVAIADGFGSASLTVTVNGADQTGQGMALAEVVIVAPVDPALATCWTVVRDIARVPRGGVVVEFRMTAGPGNAPGSMFDTTAPVLSAVSSEDSGTTGLLQIELVDGATYEALIVGRNKPQTFTIAGNAGAFRLPEFLAK